LAARVRRSGAAADTSRTFVATSAGREVVGYHTLVAGQVERDQATSSVRAGTSKHFPIPICLIARLAVDRGSQGRGLGAALLLDALRRAVGAPELVGFALWSSMRWTTRPWQFYEHFSFAPVGDEPRTLMVPLAAGRVSTDHVDLAPILLGWPLRQVLVAEDRLGA